MHGFLTRIPVRFRDLDAMGHVNHAVYFTYMEVARQEYWFALTGQSSVEAFKFVVGKAECAYRSPALLGEVVCVRLGVTRMGGASFTMQYALTDEATGRLLAEGRTELVSYDYARKKARRLTDEERLSIEAFEARHQRDS
ncbi:MAG: acyl-CoA thioesterase [Proteobacteria bacterium]|nr:acyl-CoA thioesterase [Pseudomonadota bacterium]